MALRLKDVVKGSLLRSPLPELLFRRRASQSLTAIGYHRILPPPGADFPFDEALISATPEEFEKELRYLRQNLDLLTIREWHEALKSPSSLPDRPAVLTFDDGYEDNFRFAYPILKSLRLSACFFISTRIVGTSIVPWWDEVAFCFKFSKVGAFPSPFGDGDEPYSCEAKHRKQSAKRFLAKMKASPWPEALSYLERLKCATNANPAEFSSSPLFLNWDQAREMQAGGMEFGGHTRTHPVLGRISDESLLNTEISGCFEDMTRELGERPLAFSYPEGYEFAMSKPSDAQILEAGFKISFSYIHKYAPRAPKSLFRLPRIHSEYGEDFGAFRIGMATAP